MKNLILTNLIFLISVLTANAQWQTTNGPANNNVNALMAIETQVWAGTEEGMYYLSGVWGRLSSPADFVEISSIIQNGANIFASVLHDGGVYHSADYGNNWTHKSNGLPQSGNILASIYELTNINDTIYAATSEGIYLTLAGDNSWYPLKTGIDARSLANDDYTMIAGTQDQGVFISLNGGITWNAYNNGLPATDIRAVAIHNGVFYAGTNGNGIYMLTDINQNWAAINNGYPNTRVNTILVEGTTIYTGTESEGIWVSMNNGSTWSANNTGLTNMDVRAFVIERSDLYAGTYGAGVWKQDISANIKRVTHENTITISPNPMKHSATLKFARSGKEAGTIKIINILGQNVQTITGFSGNSITIDKANLSSGIYFVEYSEGNTSLGTVKLIVD